MSFQPHTRFSIKLPANSSLSESSATKVGSFGVVAGVFALFFFSEVPKVRNDIMQVRPPPQGAPPTTASLSQQLMHLSHRIQLLILCLFSPSLQKLPLVGDYFRRDIPPEDNVSSSCSTFSSFFVRFRMEWFETFSILSRMEPFPKDILIFVENNGRLTLKRANCSHFRTILVCWIRSQVLDIRKRAFLSVSPNHNINRTCIPYQKFSFLYKYKVHTHKKNQNPPPPFFCLSQEILNSPLPPPPPVSNTNQSMYFSLFENPPSCVSV